MDKKSKKSKVLKTEKKDYIRNYASETGKKAPAGRCRNVGLPRNVLISASQTVADASSESVKSLSPAPAKPESTASPRFPFVSPNLIRVGISRLKKTPNSSNKLFTSPLLNRIKSPVIETQTSQQCLQKNADASPLCKTPNNANLVLESTGNAESTPSNSGTRRRVKKNLQEEFIDDKGTTNGPLIKNIVSEEIEDEKTQENKIIASTVQSRNITNDPANTKENEERKKQEKSSKSKNTTEVNSLNLNDDNTVKKRSKQKCKAEESSAENSTLVPIEPASKRKHAVESKIKVIISNRDNDDNRSHSSMIVKKTSFTKNDCSVVNQGIPTLLKVSKEQTDPECPQLQPEAAVIVNRNIITVEDRKSITVPPSLGSIELNDSSPRVSIIKKRVEVQGKGETIKRSLSLKRSSSSLSEDGQQDNVSNYSNNSSASSSPKSTRILLERNSPGLPNIDGVKIAAVSANGQKVQASPNIEIIRKEMAELQQNIKKKLLELDALQRAKLYREKHNLGELVKVTKVWEDGCKNALLALQQRITQTGKNVSMEVLMANFGIPSDLFQFDSFNNCFV